MQRHHGTRVVARIVLQQPAPVPAFGKFGRNIDHRVVQLLGGVLVAGILDRSRPRHQKIDAWASGLKECQQDLLFDGLGVFRRLRSLQLLEQGHRLAAPPERQPSAKEQKDMRQYAWRESNATGR